MSLKVVGSDTDRSATHDLLLTLSTMGISRTLSEINGDFSRKLQFLQPRILTAPLEGFPLEFFDGCGTQIDQPPMTFY